MIIKTLTHSSIQSALAEARALYGDDVVLLESVPPQGSQPARVTVVVEQKSTGLDRTAGEKPAPSLPGYGYGYGPTPQKKRPTPPPTREPGPKAKLAAGKSLPATEPSPRSKPQKPSPQPAETRPTLPARPVVGRGALFPATPEPQEPAPAAPAPGTTVDNGPLFEAQLKMLHQRLTLIEKKLGDSIIGVSQQWTAHPLFSLLLQKGMRPGTASRIFDAVAQQGFDYHSPAEELKWAVAQVIRKLLASTSVKHSQGTILFIGPGGAGKTSLILKLATHPNYFARRKPAIISILPENEEEVFFQDPVTTFQRYGLPVQSVRTPDEMHHALARIESFDQILIDTSSLPVHESGARRTLIRVRQIVQAIMPLQTHFVVSATYALDELSKSRLDQLPTVPDAVAITHLDETVNWGRIADWLILQQRAVQFLSSGPGIPFGAAAFTPNWFVEEILDLNTRK